MANENEFVQVIKFIADDTAVQSAIQRIREACGSNGQQNPTQGLEKGMERTGKEAEKTAKETQKISNSTKEATKETKNLTSAFEKMGGAVKSLAAAYLGFQGVSKLIGFGKGSIDAFNVQNRAERMLEFGMRQNGTADRVNELKQFASQIQGRTMYGDEAMLTAAGAWQNKIKGVNNSKRMMELVADFAAKSTGGGAVDASAMRGYSQQLMQALSGRAITLKAQGFDISAIEQLQKIRQGGGTVTEDMELAALEKVLKPIKGLSQELAQTDEGKIQQLKNTIGDMREEVGRQLLPVVAKLADEIKKNLPSIRKLFESLGKTLAVLINKLTANIDNIKLFVEGFGSFVELIGENITSIVSAAVAFKTISTVAPLVNSGLNGFSGSLLTLAKSNALGLVAAGIVGITVAAMEMSKHLHKKREDERYATADATVNEYKTLSGRIAQMEKEGENYDPLTGQTLGNLKTKQAELRTKAVNAIVAYDKAERQNGGGGVSQEWLDTLGGKIKYRQGNKEIYVYGKDANGDVTGLSDWKKKEQEFYDSQLQTMKEAKGQTTINNIRYTNNITTDSDLMAKAIKENLRTLLTSQLTFVNRSETARAMAL